MSRRALALSTLVLAACSSASVDTPKQRQEPTWRVLFDGTSLGDLAPTQFGMQSEVYVEDGRLILEQGDPLTGVTWRGAPLPTCDYAIEVRAARLRGTDFFCGLTFPVGDSHASLILGGWGGALCGISSLDDQDASDNETRSFRAFVTGKEYLVRIEVRRDRLRAFVDGERIVDVSTLGRRIDVRAEVRPSIPFGIASFATRAAIRDLRIAMLPPE
ncbi:MAG: DUF1080 domain-containing protein [Planctomycetota bacterium]